MANFSSDQKYLDKYGLSLFWDKVRQYIQNQIGGIDGTDVKLYPSGETNPTVTDQIEKLWNSIGSGELEGGISGSIEAILGQYVKDIQHADSQTTPLKVVVNEGTENEADFYTVTLEDNGLANTLSDLTTNRVSSLDPVNGGGSVTLVVDKNKGDVTLTINSQELTNKVSGLETTIDGMVKSVNKAENGDGTYVKLNIDPITGDVKLSINDQSLVSELTSIKNNYAKTEDLPTTLPNPHKFTLTYRDKENQEKVVVYDGSSAKDVDFSLYHATTSTTATRVSNALKVVDARGNAYDYNGGVMVNLSDGINYAANSGKLGGQLPSYYGKQSDITTISQKIAELEALTHVNQITTGDGASDLVKIGFSTSTGNVVASIDETNLSNKLTSIDNYTINSKKISTNPVLTGSDITLGTTVGDNVNYPTTTTLTSSIQKLRETIAGLGQVVELKGVLSSLPTTTEGYGNGDVVIVGNKEYICYNSQWYLLGDTTELSQDVSTIKSSYVKSIKATGAGVTVSPTTPDAGDVTINVDATPITNAISELEANFGNYLPLSGGTLSNSATTLLTLSNSQTSPIEVGIRLQYGSTNKGWIGYSNNQGTCLYNYNGPHYLGIKDDGTAHVDNKVILHSENYTNYQVFKNLGNNIDCNQYADHSNTNGIIYLNDTSTHGAPGNYGSVLQFGSRESNHQFFASSANSLYWRNRWWSSKEGGTDWSDWKQFAFKSDIPTIPTSLKNPYSLTIQKNGTNVATYDGSEAKTANITVTLSDVPHTHTVPKTGTTALVASKSDHSHTASSNGAHTHTVSGTVTSSLSGASAATNGPSVSYSATTGVLTITMNHTHTVSGTVTSSLSGAVAASDGAHTHTVPADTENIISVASQEHTHTTGQAQ